MAVNWMDNFNIYGTDAGAVNRMLNGVYASINGSAGANVQLVADPDVTATGRVLLVPAGFGGGNAYSGLRKVLPTNVLTLGQAMRLWLGALPGDPNMIPAPITFKDASNNFLYCLCVTTTGRLEVRSGGTGGAVVGSTPNPVLTANAWRHIEMKLVCDAAAGSVEVRIEGTTVLKVTGINTGATPISQVEIVNDPTATSTGVSVYVKDFIIWDGTTGFNNDFMGSCQVMKIIPDADVALNWTPSSGATGFNLINEVTPDDDGSYISAAAPGIPAAYKCSLSDLPVTVTSVRSVMPIHRSRKTDGGDGNIQIGAISGGSTGLGADRAITTAYTYWWDIFDTDPATAAAWSRTSVNAMNLQINRTV